jgi:hypothetical protein
LSGLNIKPSSISRGNPVISNESLVEQKSSSGGVKLGIGSTEFNPEKYILTGNEIPSLNEPAQ